MTYRIFHSVLPFNPYALASARRCQPLKLDVDSESLPEAVPRLLLVRVVQVLPGERQGGRGCSALAVLEERFSGDA